MGWFAHLGGFVAGAVLTPLLRRRYDPLLARVEAQALRGAAADGSQGDGMTSAEERRPPR